MLNDLGVETDRWRDVTQRSRLSTADRELFYQLLGAAGQVSNDQLRQQAKTNLRGRAVQWRRAEQQGSAERQRLTQSLKATPASASLRKQVNAERRQQLALRRMQSTAAAGKFSVIPFFNQPADYRGELVTLRGTALRALKIPMTSPLDPQANQDIVQRFGFDHYYEIEIVTDDSQNNPITFCVRELPPGFPTGDRIREPVELTGFFLKSWVYRSQESQARSAESRNSTERLRQVAPIFVGRQPVRIEVPQMAISPWVGFVAGSLFVVVLVAIWLTLWRNRRAERHFGESVIRQFREPEGASLKDFVAPTAEETATSTGKS
jgi:hypothetical protein